jgi:hypothetical protein
MGAQSMLRLVSRRHDDSGRLRCGPNLDIQQESVDIVRWILI